MPGQHVSPSRPKRRWMQFGLRTLFALMTLAAIGMGLFAARMERAKKQQAAVSRLRILAGGVVKYDLAKPSNYMPDGTSSTIYIGKISQPPQTGSSLEWPPDWLERSLGIDFFGNVVEVGSWVYNGRDTDLADFKSFPRIKDIDFIFAPHITDEGLAHLSGLAHLEHVRLGGSKITDEGIARLKQALPNCQIER